jgi:hypothetical protein
MQPGGGTEIYPALKEGFEALVPLDAKVKHIILLTDGEAPRGPYEELGKHMDAAQVTVSTVGIGADADTNLLKELAQLGHGRYYDGNDPFDLPRLLVKETQQVQRAAIVEEDFTPLAVAISPATEGVDFRAAPQLRGYVATTAKPQSSVLLASRQLDPVLSEWQYGLGRVMAWTSDARNLWASRWLEWPEFGRFWAQVVKRADRPPDDPNRQITVKIEGDRARITLDAQTGVEHADRHYLNFLPTEAVLVDPRGHEQHIPLMQVAPGRYETIVPVEDEGVYTLTATQIESTGETAVQSAGFVVPYSPEYGLTGTNRTLLEALARRTGGRVISEPAEAFAHTLPSVGAPRPLWPPLMVIIALLFVADVGVRRVRISVPEMKASYGALRRRLGYVDNVAVFGSRSPVLAADTQQHPRAGPSLGLVTPPRHVGPVARPGAVVHATKSSRLLAAKRRAARR